MSTLKTDTISNTAGTKTIPTNTVVDGSAKAWVNFNGTGTVAIRAAFNVSSITDHAAGDYSVNFATPLVDANYSVGGVAGISSSTANNRNIALRSYDVPQVAGSFRFFVRSAAATTATGSDEDQVHLQVFR